jgi:hypothetical protein
MNQTRRAFLAVIAALPGFRWLKPRREALTWSRIAMLQHQARGPRYEAPKLEQIPFILSTEQLASLAAREFGWTFQGPSHLKLWPEPKIGETIVIRYPPRFHPTSDPG